MFSSKLAHNSQHYSEAMDTCPAVSYIPCATSLRENTGNIITFAQFEVGNLLSETRDDAGSDDESDNDSIMPPLIIKK